LDIHLAVPEEHVSADILDPALETITRLNERLIAEGHAPTFHDALKAGVKWRSEPPGGERFDHAAKVARRGWGDCDDLAPMQAASLRVTGEDPLAEARVYKSGPGRWHAVVRRGGGDIEDPSLEAGMRQHKGIMGVAPAVCGLMFGGQSLVNGDDEDPRPKPTIALRPNRGRWEARCDLPWSESDYAISTLSRSPVARQALVGAITGACLVGESSACADDDHIDRLLAVAGILSGEHPYDVAAELGWDAVVGALPSLHAMSATVGFNFGKLFKSVAPWASQVLKFVPGIGPVASTALDVAAKFIPDEQKAAARAAVTAAAKHPATQAAHQQAVRQALSPGVQIHPGAGITDDSAPILTPLPHGPHMVRLPGGHYFMQNF
jgi:hypothetical protein